jgi:hypothetical protein
VQDKYNRNNSVVMLNAARARLSMTDDAIKDTQTWFKAKEQPNGLLYWQAHGYYMSEQAAVGALINEFLMQSVDGIVRVFPAWPKDKDAGFTRLRAQGGFLVSAKQEKGKVAGLEIESTVGGKFRLLSPWPTIKVKVNGKEERIKPDDRGIVEIATASGDMLTFAEQ